MGFGATRARLTLAIAVTVAMALSGCSVAGLPSFKPLPAKQQATATPKAKPANESSVTTVLAYASPAPATPQRTGPAHLNALIEKHANHYGVPVALVHRLVAKESNYRPTARNGPNIGLMQIQHATARSMGYRGSAEGLLDADTNLKYAVKYLRGAYVVGGYNQDAAIRLYQRGYYYDAKAKGLLDEAGLR